MKIAVSGAHRVGKTTLIEKLQESLPEYESMSEPYYQLENEGHLFGDPPDSEDYIDQFKYSLHQISISSHKVIFDRCPIDLLAYLHALNPSKNIQSFYQNAQNVMSEIDLLVFVPIEQPDLIFCPESEYPTLRYQVNEILNEWIWDFGIETIEVKGTISVRRVQVINKILNG